MEVWDLYDKARRPLGKEHIRGERLPEGAYHLVVHVWIKNKKGQYLISRRSANRPTFPLMYECVGGSVLGGESSLDGALREAKEEVGAELEKEKGRLLFTKVRGCINGKSFQDIMDVWLFEYEKEVSLERATTDEVCELHWMSPKEIKDLYEAHKLVGTLDYFFQAVAGEPSEANYQDIIGKKVKGSIDRPAGSRHPKHPDIVYPVNYGYVDGVLGGDGEEQDVYFLGTKEPLSRFEGVVIAVFHRFNDAEDKWIAAEEGTVLTEDEILGEIAFQEQFFYGKLFS